MKFRNLCNQKKPIVLIFIHKKNKSELDKLDKIGKESPSSKTNNLLKENIYLYLLLLVPTSL